MHVLFEKFMEKYENFQQFLSLEHKHWLSPYKKRNIMRNVWQPEYDNEIASAPVKRHVSISIYAYANILNMLVRWRK